MASLRNDRAFTMIELAVVLAVVAVLAAIAAPSMARFRDKYRLRRVSNDYMTTVNLTRIQTISENRALRIYHYVDANHDDGGSSTTCIWDVRAETSPNSGEWETIPLDGYDGYPNKFGQTGFYSYSDDTSPDYVPHISIMDGGEVDNGTWFEFNTKGYIGSYSGNAYNGDDQSGVGCLKRIGFRNKGNNKLSQVQVCIGTSGIATLQSS
ncbi:MAG: prepilin-type N-terminal cleavage/methylation domain-containing protein [Myxococcota bacterium]|nr:prepilin-type N-terminal cleavage/methylation domain-containing protein [Myxococcota bacterium]